MCRCRKPAARLQLPLLLPLLWALCLPAAAEERYGIGRAAQPEEIAGWDIDVRFDGKGLPPGQGDVESGEVLFEEQCASCHGDFGQGEGRWPVLAGGFDSLQLQGAAGRPEKTVGSYWPYAPTLFDYIRRTMPYTAPQSLSEDQTYALSAYVLYLNDIVEDDFVADARSLAAVKMPNRDNFFDDPRPDVKNTACMKDCLNPQELELLESIRGVTPAQEAANSTAAASGSRAAGGADAAGAETYRKACAVCHSSGVAEAPIAAAAGGADWQARLNAAGMTGLLQSSLNGKGAMPPQKAVATDDEMIAAIHHMLSLAGVEY